MRAADMRKRLLEFRKERNIHYQEVAKNRGLTLIDMRSITSIIKEGKMSAKEAQVILNHEKSKFIKWRIRKALEKA